MKLPQRPKAWPDNPSIVSRYVFFNRDAQDSKVLTAAKKAARSRGRWW